MIALPSLTRRALGRTALLAGIGGALYVKPIPARANTPKISCVDGAGKPENPGLIDDRSYQGPTYYQTISWDPKVWQVGERENDAVAKALAARVEPVDCGTGNGGSDLLTLSHVTFPDSVIVIETYQRGMWTYDTLRDSAQMPGFMNNLHIPAESEPLLFGTVDGSDEHIALLARDSEDADHVVYQEIFLPKDSDAFIRSVTLHLGNPEAYAQTLDDAATIALEDFTLYTAIDEDRILGEIGS
jgi:hypothetical protein